MRWPWKRTAEEPEALPVDAVPGEHDAFVDSARDYFAQAWAAGDTDERVEAFANQTDAERRDEDRLARQLTRRSRGPYLLLAVVAIAGGVTGYGVRSGWFDSSPDADGETGLVFESVIARPQDPRSYAGEAMPSSVELAAELDRGIRQTSGGPELLPAAPAVLPVGTRFTPILWGNRLQVLVVGPEELLDDACLVVSLVSDDLEALDVAARGAACDPLWTVTGDRRSCADSDIELVEVWPPAARDDLLGAPEPVERIRVRVERPVGDATLSVRGELDLRGVELTDLPVVGGEPGTAFRTSFGGSSRSCTLIDRSGVEIKVL